MFSCLDYLLDNGANPTLKNCKGYSAVHYAAAYGNKQHLELVSGIFWCRGFDFDFFLNRLQSRPKLGFLSFFSHLQLLEISFNCLEEVESNIPVSPLHLAVSTTRLQLIYWRRTFKWKPHAYKPLTLLFFAFCCSGILWSLWGPVFALWDVSESGCSGHWRQNSPPPGCSERFCPVCGSAAETSSLLHTEGAQAQVDSSPCCRHVLDRV